MAIAKLTQYLLPDGRQKSVECEVTDDLTAQLESMQGAGAKLEAEVLRTGEVSLTVTHATYGDFDIEVIPNDSNVPKALKRLVRRFDTGDFDRWSNEGVTPVYGFRKPKLKGESSGHV